MMEPDPGGYAHIQGACGTAHGNRGMDIALSPTRSGDAVLFVPEDEAGSIRSLAVREVHFGFFAQPDALESTLTEKMKGL